MITRFAPSPTGPLHLGHAFAAILAHDMALTAGGRFLLRIEDIDRARSRPEWEAAILDDLGWLGLTWETPAMRQSDRMPVYAAALDNLWDRGLLYPCTCTRRDIEAALTAPQDGGGPDGPVYPGTCRPPRAAGTRSDRPTDATLRLDIAAAVRLVGGTAADPRGSLWFEEAGAGPNGERGRIRTRLDAFANTVGDVVVARKGIGTSYHLAVVVDDAAQGVTDVTRGVDLFEATRIHVLLQALLNLRTPCYRHHRLIRDAAGKRLAKRDDARALSRYRAEGATPGDIRRLVGLG